MMINDYDDYSDHINDDDYDGDMCVFQQALNDTFLNQV